MRSNSFFSFVWNELRKLNEGAAATVALLDSVRGRHGVALGHPGMGKTRLIEWLLVSDVIRRTKGESERGWCFLDPHGDASDAIISRLSILSESYSPLRDLIVVIDPTRYDDWTVGFNPLEPIVPDDKPERIARRFADAVVSVFDDDPTVVVRMFRIIYNSALVLTLTGGFVSDIPRLLTDTAYRAEVRARVQHKEAKRFWEDEFPEKPSPAMERSESSLNRIERLLQDPDICALFAGRGTINFRQLMDEGYFVIVRCPRGKLTKDTTSLALSLFTTAIEAAAFSRDDIPERERRPFSLVADEFVLYLSNAMPEIIQEGRKFKLDLLLFGQSVAQTERNKLLRDVLGTVDYLMTFRLGWEDADVLYHDMFLPELDQVKERKRRVRMVAGIPLIETDKVWRTQEEIAEIMRRQIMTLPPQTLFFKRRGELSTHRVRVVNVPDIEDHPLSDSVPKLRAKLLGTIRGRYGRDKQTEAKPDDPEDETGY